MPAGHPRCQAEPRVRATLPLLDALGRRIVSARQRPDRRRAPSSVCPSSWPASSHSGRSRSAPSPWSSASVAAPAAGRHRHRVRDEMVSDAARPAWEGSRGVMERRGRLAPNAPAHWARFSSTFFFTKISGSMKAASIEQIHTISVARTQVHAPSMVRPSDTASVMSEPKEGRDQRDPTSQRTSVLHGDLHKERLGHHLDHREDDQRDEEGCAVQRHVVQDGRRDEKADGVGPQRQRSRYQHTDHGSPPNCLVITTFNSSSESSLAVFTSVTRSPRASPGSPLATHRGL